MVFFSPLYRPLQAGIFMPDAPAQMRDDGAMKLIQTINAPTSLVA